MGDFRQLGTTYNPRSENGAKNSCGPLLMDIARIKQGYEWAGLSYDDYRLALTAD